MSWSLTFPEPITLKSGRVIASLSEARVFILEHDKSSLTNPAWGYAAELLSKAAVSGAAADLREANLQMSRALRTEEFT